jgi:hypothetical protein
MVHIDPIERYLHDHHHQTTTMKNAEYNISISEDNSVLPGAAL